MQNPGEQRGKMQLGNGEGAVEPDGNAKQLGNGAPI